MAHLEPQLITVGKDRYNLAFLRHLYHRQKTTNNRVCWRCVDWRDGCKGTMITNLENRDPVLRNPHNHLPDGDRVSMRALR